MLGLAVAATVLVAMAMRVDRLLEETIVVSGTGSVPDVLLGCLENMLLKQFPGQG